MIDETAKKRVADVLEILVEAAAESLEPDETVWRIEQLEAGPPVEVVWQRENYDDSLHYDAIIESDAGSISVSYAADRGLPWPLRGVRRWSEEDMLRVGERTLKVQEAMIFLDFIWSDAPLLDRLVQACIVEDALEQGAVTVPAADLQAELDGFRRRRGLLRAADMHAWLAERGMTQARLERFLAVEAATRLLRERTSAGRVEQFFTERKGELGCTVVTAIAFSSRADAEAALEGLADHAKFYREFERAASRGRARFETLVDSATDTPAELAAASVGQVVGPVGRESSFVLLRVVAKLAAVLDERTRRVVEERLFEEWVTEERRKRRVEWSWGPRDSGHRVVGAPIEDWEARTRSAR